MLAPNDDKYFCLLAEATTTGVVIHDADANIVFMNDHAKAFLGLHPDAPIPGGEHEWYFENERGDRLRPEQYPVAIAIQSRQRVEGYTLCHVGSGGQTRKWAICNAVAVLPDDGSLEQILVGFEDVTEARAMSDQLAREKERLEIAQRAAKVGTWEFDLRTGQVTWSEFLFDMYGVTPPTPPTFEELLSLLQESDAAELRSAVDRAITKGEGYELMQQVERPDGSICYIKGVGQPLRGQSGRVEKLHGTAIDVSESMETEAELRTLALVAKTTDNPVVITDREGRIEWVNDGFTKVTEFRLDEVVGRKPGEILQRDDVSQETVEQVRAAIREQRPITAEILNYSKSGRAYWLHMNIQPIFDRYKRLTRFVAIELDLTERVNAEKQAAELTARLEKAVADKDKFFSIIAHDLIAPFTGLNGLMTLMIEHLEPTELDETLKSLAHDIKRNGENTLALLRNLLTWAQSETGALRPRPIDVNLGELIATSCEGVERFASQKDVHLHFDVVDDVVLALDRDMMRSVIQNLVTNAVKFSHPRSHVDIQLTPDAGEEIALSVTDHGIGMEPETLRHLFEQSHKASRRGTDGEKGTGLGLLLCKDFVEQNGGKICCESAPGEGSQFTVRFKP